MLARRATVVDGQLSKHHKDNISDGATDPEESSSQPQSSNRVKEEKKYANPLKG